MQIVSGVLGKENVHFKAPPAAEVPAEMKRFIQWFNNTAPAGKAPIALPAVRAALVHLYFESVHPFEDGNGRIGRALAEKALAQSAGVPLLLSLSTALEAEQLRYYQNLEAAQKQLEVTPWILFFTQMLTAAAENATRIVEFTVLKTRFFDRYKSSFNDRQKKAIARMWQVGPSGFTGGLPATKYMSITGASKATATRDLQLLLQTGALVKLGESGGRSTRYALNEMLE